MAHTMMAKLMSGGHFVFTGIQSCWHDLQRWAARIASDTSNLGWNLRLIVSCTTHRGCKSEMKILLGT